MTKQEKKEITDFLNGVFLRINKAREALDEQNYGTAKRILSAAYPELKIKVDD